MSSKRKLFHDKPTTMVDNYFVTNTVIDWAGNESLGTIGTNGRNRIPKDIEPFYLHKDKTNTTMKNTKAAIFFETIVSVKNDSRGFQRVHFSFKSTPSCNIAYVSDIN